MFNKGGGNAHKRMVVLKAACDLVLDYFRGSSGNLVAVVRHEIELAAIEEDACAIVCEVAKASGG
jgi:hypothetical protein